DEAVFEKDMNDAFARHANLPPQIQKTYLAKGSEKLLDALAFDCVKGITATACGFYGPQGRQLRLRTAIDDINGILASFSYNGHRITNFEMETSAIYGLAKLLGHNALTVCLIIANRPTGKFLSGYHPQMKQTITTMMDRVAAM
ncbi:MAG: phosphorylase, partial [Bacteroidales bacterium]|nr:phosphorylase [Bacteroidales bacterium]